jgi:hypothetical protein
MTQQERKKRPQPQRSAPRRSFIQHDHPGEGEQLSSTPEAPPEIGGINDVIGNAVKLGYSVVDEQLQQGRHSARRFREGSYSSADLEDDVTALAGRLVRVAKDAMVAWLDIISAGARLGALPGAGLSGGGTMPVEVKSARPVQVTLDLRPTSARFAPVVHAVHPTPPGSEPLTDVQFKLGPDGRRCVLAITVPDHLAPGTYTGVVVDRLTHEPGGTLCVRVHPKD